MHKYLRLSRGMILARSDYTEIYLLEKEVFPENCNEDNLGATDPKARATQVLNDAIKSNGPSMLEALTSAYEQIVRLRLLVQSAPTPPSPKIQIMVYPRSIEDYRKMKTLLKLTEIADVTLKMLEDTE